MSFGNQDLGGQTGDGIVIGGATYMIATDWGSGGGTGFTATHVQIVKPGWGDTDNTHRVTTSKPLPVQIWNTSSTIGGATVNSGALEVTGGVAISSDLAVNTLPVNVRDTGTQGGAVVGSRTVTSIIQVVGPTMGVCGPTAYGPNAGGAVTDDYFAPIRVTGSVKGQLTDGYFGVTFAEADVRSLYGGPIGWPGFGGTYSGYTAHGGTLGSYGVDYGSEPYPLKDIDWMMIQGMSAGTPVGVTAQSSAGLLTRRMRSRYAVGDYGAAVSDTKDSIAVEGFAGMTALSITGGVRIESQPNGGSFEIRNLVYSRDSIAISGHDGTTGAHVKLFGSNGDPIGVSAGALKVAVDNGAFDITANINQEIEIKGYTGGGIRVRGITHEALEIRGMLSGGAVEVSSPSGFNIRNLNANDLVSLGGVAGDNLTTIKTAANNISSKANTIVRDTNSINVSSNSIKEQFTGLASNETGYKSYEDNLAGVTMGFAVNVIASKQPSELISITKTVNRNRQPLGTGVPIINGVTIQAHPNNTGAIILSGASQTSEGYHLEAGDSIFLQIDQLGKIFASALSTTGGGVSIQKVNIIGS